MNEGVKLNLLLDEICRVYYLEKIVEFHSHGQNPDSRKTVVVVVVAVVSTDNSH